MDFLDYMTSLTGAEANARAGQNVRVKAKVLTNGRSFILGKSGKFGEDNPIISQFSANQLLGILQETVTISQLFPGSTKYVKVFYSKVTLDEPFYDKDENFIEYMFFQTKDLAFVNGVEPVVPTSGTKTLEPIYCTSADGIRLRQSPNLSSKFTVVSYGDIVGYTDNTTKTYLTYTFWKIYNAKGVEIGWVAKGEKFTSKTKPQAKALPKVNQDGTTDQGYADITKQQDPQGGNSTASVKWTTVVAYVLGGTLVIFLLVKGIASLFKNKPKIDGKQQ